MTKKAATAATAVQDPEGTTPATVAPDAEDPRDAVIASLQAQLNELRESQQAERKTPIPVQEEKDYAWPKATPEQLRRAQPQIPTTRVYKVGRLDPWERFDVVDGQRTVRIEQFRVPMADGKWDLARVRMEMDALGIAPLKDIFPNDPDCPIYCQLKDCWNPATHDGAFCHPKHKEYVLGAHDRQIVME